MSLHSDTLCHYVYILSPDVALIIICHNDILRGIFLLHMYSVLIVGGHRGRDHMVVLCLHMPLVIIPIINDCMFDSVMRLLWLCYRRNVEREIIHRYCSLQNATHYRLVALLPLWSVLWCVFILLFWCILCVLVLLFMCIVCVFILLLLYIIYVRDLLFCVLSMIILLLLCIVCVLVLLLFCIFCVFVLLFLCIVCVFVCCFCVFSVCSFCCFFCIVWPFCYLYLSSMCSCFLCIFHEFTLLFL